MSAQKGLSPELFSFFDNTPDLVALANREGFFRYVNDAVVNTLQYSRPELFMRPISEFIHPDDKERTAFIRQELLGGKALVNFENRYISKSGGVVWLHWTSIYFPDKELVFAMAKNVTARKTREENLEMLFRKQENLASHFKEKLEGDKRSLARELHDELAQLATAIKTEINWLGQQPCLEEQAQQRAERTSALLDLLINSIRRISYAISPTMLDDVGLNETLQWLCEEFTRQNGIACYFETDGDDKMLSHEIQLDIFRICQDALSNISQHEDVSVVNVELLYEANRIKLSITDNGTGTDTEALMKKPVITAILERTASVNGNITLNSQPGEGTQMQVIIDDINLFNRQ